MNFVGLSQCGVYLFMPVFIKRSVNGFDEYTGSGKGK